MLSVRMPRDAAPEIRTDPSTQVPQERAGGPPPGYRPPAPEDTPCLQPEYVSRCIGQSRSRTGLMALAGLQEERLRRRGSYAGEAATLGFEPESGMVLNMRAGPDGWTAEYHSVAGGVGCAVYGGDVEEPFETFGGGGVPESPGAVACDNPLAGAR